MAASKFSPELCADIIEMIEDGLSLRDIARSVEVSEKTLKNWLTRGRKEGAGPYFEFVKAVDQAREGRDEREAPMTEEELRLTVSRAARKGSVQAQKLYWEMLRATKSPNEKPDDPFAALDGGDRQDELAKAREAKQATR